MKKGRLSLDDFKLNKVEGSSELDLLLSGDVAGSCHSVISRSVQGKTTYIWQDPIPDIPVPTRKHN
jgi:hypothetical protein